MSLSKTAIGKRFGLLAALVTALVVACAGVVLAQSSSANAGYKGSNTVATPTDAPRVAADHLGAGPSASGEVSVAANLSNGDFETGDFSGWKRANRRGENVEGNWFVYSGTTSPISFSNIVAPPQGTFAATTDQDGPGSHILYRNIKLKEGMNHALSFYLYYNNFNDAFFTPNTLSSRHPQRNENQQYRVDLMKPSAKPFSMNKDDIRENLFRTEVSDPNTLAPTLMTFDLTKYAGKTVRLRFAEVDNQSNFLASVDDVKVSSE